MESSGTGWLILPCWEAEESNLTEVTAFGVVAEGLLLSGLGCLVLLCEREDASSTKRKRKKKTFSVNFQESFLISLVLSAAPISSFLLSLSEELIDNAKYESATEVGR